MRIVKLRRLLNEENPNNGQITIIISLFLFEKKQQQNPKMNNKNANFEIVHLSVSRRFRAIENKNSKIKTTRNNLTSLYLRL